MPPTFDDVVYLTRSPAAWLHTYAGQRTKYLVERIRRSELEDKLAIYRRGRPRNEVMRRKLRDLLQEKPDATNKEIWETLTALQDGDDDTVHEVFEKRVKDACKGITTKRHCAPHDHVHYWRAPKVLDTMSQGAVYNLAAEIRKKL
jgi:hypothetical protein